VKANNRETNRAVDRLLSEMRGCQPISERIHLPIHWNNMVEIRNGPIMIVVYLGPERSPQLDIPPKLRLYGPMAIHLLFDRIMTKARTMMEWMALKDAGWKTPTSPDSSLESPNTPTVPFSQFVEDSIYMRIPFYDDMSVGFPEGGQMDPNELLHMAASTEFHTESVTATVTLQNPSGFLDLRAQMERLLSDPGFKLLGWEWDNEHAQIHTLEELISDDAILRLRSIDIEPLVDPPITTRTTGTITTSTTDNNTTTATTNINDTHEISTTTHFLARTE